MRHYETMMAKVIEPMIGISRFSKRRCWDQDQLIIFGRLFLRINFAILSMVLHQIVLTIL